MKSGGISSSSIANKYGYSQSTKENATSPSAMKFGLNPNINIEDEYIENLLKQTHFMNMEIKLLKQKQAQSDNNALWGIVNRTNEPLIKNIVDSSTKYQEMKKNMDQAREQLTAQNIRLADEQNAILKEYQYLEAKITSVQKKKQALSEKFTERSSKNVTKIEDFDARLKAITEEKEAQLKKHAIYESELEQITNEADKEHSRTEYELSRIRNDEVIEEQMEKEKIEAIEEIKSKIKNLKQKFESNEDYQKAQEEQTNLRDRIEGLEKGISGANFDLMQLNESIKMAEVEKEKQIKERKQLTEEFESTKTMLMEILFMNFGRKQKESELRKRQSPEIQKAEYQTKKLEKSLEEIKKKLAKCQDTQSVLKVEVEGLERELAKLQQKRTLLKDKLEKVLSANQEQERDMQAVNGQVRKLSDQQQKVNNEQYLITCQLQQVEKEVSYLRGRKDFLTETLNLKDTLNEARLDQLQKVVQKNNDLNSTVGMLMGKWEEIKSFSRM